MRVPPGGWELRGFWDCQWRAIDCELERAARSPVEKYVTMMLASLRGFLLALSLCLGLSGWSVTTSLGEELDAATLQRVLEAGEQLERESRWQEAIQHYERAIRKHGSHPAIQHRLDVDRIHQDVVRRHTDRSYLEAIRTASPAQALDLLTEVLAKLEMNYVDPIDLPQLLRHGTAFLEVALVEQDFLKRHLPGADREQIESFRLNVHRQVLGRPVANLGEARALVASVARLTERQIGVPPTVTIYEYVAGAVGLLDPYSGFLTADEFGEIMSQIEGNLIGLGVELWAEGNELRIVEVFRDGPAARAGLRPGERILEVDGLPTSQVGAKRAADLLRGEEDSQVTLLCDSEQLGPRRLTVRRGRVEVPSLCDSRLVDAEAGIGYVRLSNFQKTTVREMEQAVGQLQRQGMQTLVIDLRRNPGGLLDAAVELADRFLSAGPIVSTRGRSGAENRNYLPHSENTWSIPLMVLVDQDSASASEIFAGAIHDHARGVIVGSTTFGKGSVQGLFHTETANAGLRLTVSKFYSPNGEPINARGVRPDVAVEPRVAAKPESGAAGPNWPLTLGILEQDEVLRQAVRLAKEPRQARLPSSAPRP